MLSGNPSCSVSNLYFLLPFLMSTVANSALAEDSAKTSGKPVKIFRIRGLSVSIFYNRSTVRGREIAFPNVYLQRTYKVGDTFKTTTSLGRDDLLVAQQLLQQAWQWIVTEEAAARSKW